MDFQLAAKEAQLTYAALSFSVPKELQESPQYRTQNVALEAEGFRSARVAFGKSPEKSFTNEIEMMVEYKDALAGAADFKEEPGKWTWVLGSDEDGFDAPLRYHNRVAIGLGAAVNGKPKSNVVGQRVYHWVNWLDLENWYPTEEQIDKMVANHGTMLILHHEYMLQRGSNGYPHADYAVMRDHDAMVRSIDYARQKGLRVGLYMRGVEMYALDAEFFQKYCKRNWDGIYTDWHGPIAVSWHEMKYAPEEKLGDAHFREDGSHVPARAYFLFTKNQREIVGPDGFLIGHQGSFNSGVFANLCYDAYLPGETGSDRHMFSSRDEAAYKGMTGGCVCMPWTLDLPAYRNAEGAAKMAAWGYYPHLVMGIESRWSNENVTFTLDPDDALYDFVEPYWNVLAHIDAEKASVHNLPSQAVTAVESSNPDFQSVVYRQEGDVYLLVTANLGEETGSAELSLVADVLEMEGKYKVTRIDTATGAAKPAGTSDGSVKVAGVRQWGIEGYLFTKQ
jgi:hypothetical protein